MENIDYQKQSIITRAIIKAAVLMSEYGAESILIEQTAQRLGHALGVDSVEISMIPVAIVLTTLHKHQSVTTTRRVHHKPINMSIVCDIQKIVIDIEKKSYDVTYLLAKLKEIQPNYYNRWCYKSKRCDYATDNTIGMITYICCHIYTHWARSRFTYSNHCC